MHCALRRVRAACSVVVVEVEVAGCEMRRDARRQTDRATRAGTRPGRQGTRVRGQGKVNRALPASMDPWMHGWASKRSRPPSTQSQAHRKTTPYDHTLSPDPITALAPVLCSTTASEQAHIASPPTQRTRRCRLKITSRVSGPGRSRKTIIPATRSSTIHPLSRTADRPPIETKKGEEARLRSERAQGQSCQTLNLSLYRGLATCFFERMKRRRTWTR